MLRIDLRQIAVLVASCALISACEVLSTPESLPYADLPENEEITTTGTVLENDHSCEVDVACFLRIQTGDEQFILVYHYGEWPPCTNVPAIRAGSEVEAGDQIEVFGRVDGEGTYSTCDSDEYYIPALP